MSRRSAERAAHPPTIGTTVDAGGLETARLRLRPIGPADLGVIVRIHTDPELMAHIHNGAPRRAAECPADLDRALAGWDADRFGAFVVETPDHALVGTVGLGRPEWCPSAMPGPDLGWTILQEHQGHGYAAEAATGLLGWFFANRLGPRVVGIHNTTNPRSGAVMRRLGMRWLRQERHPACGYPIEIWELIVDSWHRPAHSGAGDPGHRGDRDP